MNKVKRLILPLLLLAIVIFVAWRVVTVALPQMLNRVKTEMSER